MATAIQSNGLWSGKTSGLPIKFAASIEPFTPREEWKAFHSGPWSWTKTKKPHAGGCVQRASVSGKLTPEWRTAFDRDGKKCCGNEWVALVSGPSHWDVKPVVEHIEDDLKYDFRTKTHSF